MKSGGPTLKNSVITGKSGGRSPPCLRPPPPPPQQVADQLPDQPALLEKLRPPALILLPSVDGEHGVQGRPDRREGQESRALLPRPGEARGLRRGGRVAPVVVGQRKGTLAGVECLQQRRGVGWSRRGGREDSRHF